jgi:acetoin utilization deacetylase AcuC-like enzyme
VGLEDFTGDETYLRLLRNALDQAFEHFAREETKRGSSSPHLIFYLAGADPYREDQLGGLSLTLDGLRERDRIVIEAARARGIPIAITFAGGYARKVTDTVDIHVNTILAARDAFKDKAHADG